MGEIIITGGNGFIGHYLANFFAGQGFKVKALMRAPSDKPFYKNVTPVVIPAYADEGWGGDDVFSKDCIVIHTAGRAHHFGENAENIALYRNENVAFPLRIARLAHAGGARHFIFLSSIGAALLEHEISGGLPREKMWAHHPYRASKLDAEEKLTHLSRELGLKITSLRMPLVYGRGAPGNIQTLLSVLKRGLPLPLGSIKNQRAFLSIENVADFLLHISAKENSSAGIWAIRDADMPSTPAFIHALAAAAEYKKPFLFSCPVSLLKALGALTGRKGQVESLTESLVIDLAPVTEMLGWKPLFDTKTGLSRAFSSKELHERGQTP